MGILLAVFLCGSPANAEEPSEAPAEPQTLPNPEHITIQVVGKRSHQGYTQEKQVTATRDERRIFAQPQSVTVLGRQLMDDVSARRTEDVLQFSPGVQLFSGYGGTWDDYIVRGFRVWSGTTYRNGYLNGYSGPNATDAVNVERIEIIRGPASALYGAGLPGGSINFVTKLPLSEPMFRARLFAGSFDTLRGELDASAPLTRDSSVLARLTLSGDTTEGYRDFNDFRRWTANPVVSIELSPRTRVLAEVHGYHQRYRADPRGVPLVNGDAFALPVRRSFTEPQLPLATMQGLLGRIELVHELSERWFLRIGTQDKAARYEELALNPLGIAEDGRTMSRILLNWESSSADTAFQVALRGQADTGTIRHDIMTGVDLGQENVKWQLGFSDPSVAPLAIDIYAPRYGLGLPPAPLPPGPANTWHYVSFGAYANDVLTLLPGLKVMAGGRFDTYRQRTDTAGFRDEAGELALSGRAGVVYLPVAEAALYANLSNGFWPVLGVAADGGVLEPERSLGYEVGARVAIERTALTVDVTLFHIENSNISVPDPERPDFQVQRGRAESQGFETFVTGQINQWLRMLASYSYTNAEITEDPNPELVGTELPLVAEHSGGAFAQFEVPEGAFRGVGLGSGVVYTSERNLDAEQEIPGYARVDATLSYRFARMRSQLRIENLFGARYIRSGNDALGVLPGAPRSFLLSTEVLLR